VHVNYLEVSPPSLIWHPLKLLRLVAGLAFNGKLPGTYSPDEIADLKAARKFAAEELGYREIQRTKPLTLSYGLTDSPVGLLAWIREKMHSWSDGVQCPLHSFLPSPLSL
jgi:hypothetical protein